MFTGGCDLFILNLVGVDAVDPGESSGSVPRMGRENPGCPSIVTYKVLCE